MPSTTFHRAVFEVKPWAKRKGNGKNRLAIYMKKAVVLCWKLSHKDGIAFAVAKKDEDLVRFLLQVLPNVAFFMSYTVATSSSSALI